MNKMMGALSASAFAVAAIATPALADGWDHGGSTKDAPVENSRKWTFSFNIGGTSDYVFRGVSQSDEEPAFQAGVDVTWGLLYVGVWGSGVDRSFVGNASAEVDVYAGVTPSAGIFDFDLGAIYYGYPGYSKTNPINGSRGVDVDYWELKAGVSTDDLVKNLTVGATFYWSPENTFETGDTYIYEGSVSYALPQMWVFTPTVSALIGHLDFDDDTLGTDYTYWNAGIELAIEKISLDFRYWDTDTTLINAAGTKDLAAERFVFTAKFTY